MVKLVFLCRRRPDLSHDRYTTLLLEGHVPLALRHHPTMRRYVVNLVERTLPGAAEIDSVGELSFDSLEDFQERLYDSPAGRAVIERDVAGFMGGAHAYVTTAHAQKAPPSAPAPGVRSPGVKLIAAIGRRPGMTHEAFVEHWLTRHAPLALRHHPAMSGYVTNVVTRRLGDAGEEWDGIAELHLPSREALETGLFDSPEGERAIREDMARFIGRMAGYHCAEYVQKRPG